VDYFYQSVGSFIFICWIILTRCWIMFIQVLYHYSPVLLQTLPLSLLVPSSLCCPAVDCWRELCCWWLLAVVVPTTCIHADGIILCCCLKWGFFCQHCATRLETTTINVVAFALTIPQQEAVVSAIVCLQWQGQYQNGRHWGHGSKLL